MKQSVRSSLQPATEAPPRGRPAGARPNGHVEVQLRVVDRALRDTGLRRGSAFLIEQTNELTKSNLMPAGVSAPVVRRVIRHRDPRLTMKVYGHLSPEYVLREIDKLKLGIAPEAAEEAPAEESLLAVSAHRRA